MQSRFSPRDTLIVHLAVYRIALAFLGTCVEKFLPIRSRQTVATVRLAWRNDLSLYALPFEPYVLRQWSLIKRRMVSDADFEARKNSDP